MRNVLCRQVDGRCDKLVVDRRKYCQLSSTDDGLVYLLTVDLCRDELLGRSMPKNSSIRTAVLIGLRLVTDRQTDRQTDGRTDGRTQDHSCSRPTALAERKI